MLQSPIYSSVIWELAEKCQREVNCDDNDKENDTKGARIGGRQLRRLALLAFSQHIGNIDCSLDKFLEALEHVIDEEMEKRGS